MNNHIIDNTCYLWQLEQNTKTASAGRTTHVAGWRTRALNGGRPWPTMAGNHAALPHILGFADTCGTCAAIVGVAWSCAAVSSSVIEPLAHLVTACKRDGWREAQHCRLSPCLSDTVTRQWQLTESRRGEGMYRGYLSTTRYYARHLVKLPTHMGVRRPRATEGAGEAIYLRSKPRCRRQNLSRRTSPPRTRRDRP